MERTTGLRGEALRVNRKELILGAALVLLGLLMPLALTVEGLGVRPLLDAALMYDDEVGLLEAALRLVLLNALRAVPNYIGAFFIGEAVEYTEKQSPGRLLNALITVVTLITAYALIGFVHGIRYDFGLPAVAVCMLVLLFGRMDYSYIALRKKAVLIALFVTAFQFFDIMPMVSRFPAGRGETSWNIKQAAGILEAETLLNIGGMVAALMFALFGVIVWALLRDENRLRALRALEEQNREIRMQAHLTEIENRTNREVQYLVHDLKSPLTAIATMTGILRIERESEETPRFPKDGDYLDRIEGAVDQMSRMISEILYEEKCSPITTDALLHIVLAQVSVTDYVPHLTVRNEAEGESVTVNRILFPRALINLLQNSAQAMDGTRTPHIGLSVTREGENIAFTVSDNGCGIPQDRQQSVWDRGFSGRASSGLGLAFVRKTVQDMGGEISLSSRVGEGTSITIRLPRGERNDE